MPAKRTSSRPVSGSAIPSPAAIRASSREHIANGDAADSAAAAAAAAQQRTRAGIPCIARFVPSDRPYALGALRRLRRVSFETGGSQNGGALSGAVCGAGTGSGRAERSRW